MKPILPLISISAAFAVMSSPAIAQDGSFEDPEAKKHQNDAEPTQAHPDVSGIPQQRRASKVIGLNVHNFDQEKIGAVSDLVISTAGSRITAVIISSGGFLGMNDELSILPPPVLKYDAKEEVYKVQIKKDQLEQAPHFNNSEWPDLNDQDFMSKVNHAYQIEPRLTADARKDIPSGDMSHHVVRASKLLSMEVIGTDDKKIGDIDEIVVNQNLNRVTSVVISSGGFLGLGNTLSAVPADALTLVNDDQLRMDVTKETLEKSPRLTEEDWEKQTSDESFLDRVYAPFQTSKGNDDPDQPNTMDQGSDEQAVQTTRDIRRKIIDRDDLSFGAKNIQIITSDKEISLAGVVKSEKEKSIISDIVSGVANDNFKVTNRITINEKN